MARRLGREEMLRFVEDILHPGIRRLPSDQVDQQLLLFCINCPDPVVAMDIIVETPGPLTAAQLVDMALACPPRRVATYTEAELPGTHPLRTMKLDP